MIKSFKNNPKFKKAYGYCPKCHESGLLKPGIIRERRNFGYDQCEKQHIYKSLHAVFPKDLDAKAD